MSENTLNQKHLTRVSSHARCTFSTHGPLQAQAHFVASRRCVVDMCDNKILKRGLQHHHLDASAFARW